MLNTFDGIVNQAEDVKVLPDILSPMINFINDQLVLNLVDICPDNMLQILYKSLLSFGKIWKIDHSKIPRIRPVKF